MIDTICLLIPRDKIKLKSMPEGTTLFKMQSDNDFAKKFVLNPSKTQIETGKYYPRMTGYKRKFSQDAQLKVELSLPKLLYKNNVDELEDADFDEVITILKIRIEEMGVYIEKWVLEYAQISAIHFSKNIIFTDGITSKYVISELHKIDFRKTFDFTKTKFANEGQSIYAYTGSHHFTLYDKIADINQNLKRGKIDRSENTFQERSLFDELEKKNVVEILRMEARITMKVKLNSMLEKLGYKKNIAFKDIFKKEISQKIVYQYWTDLVSKNNMILFSLNTTPKDILRTLQGQVGIKTKEIIYQVGLIMLSKDDAGIRQLRQILSKKHSDRNWQRFKQDIIKVGNFLSKNNVRNWVSEIEKQLVEFNSVKVKDLGLEIP